MPTTEDTCLLQLRSLSLRFGDRIIFRDLNLKVETGEKIAVTGESGSGKTTLLGCMIGFHSPDSGMVSIQGQELSGDSVWELRGRIGYVPQEPDLGEGTVREILERPFAYRANRNLTYDPSRVGEIFREFRLDEELLGQTAARLSGGEKQRVALISSLLLERTLYLLDEVTSALDERTRDAFLAYCRRRRDIAMIAVTHDRDLINHCGRIYHLEAGKLAVVGAT